MTETIDQAPVAATATVATPLPESAGSPSSVDPFEDLTLVREEALLEQPRLLGRPIEDRTFEGVEVGVGLMTGVAVGSALGGPIGTIVGGLLGAAAGLAVGEVLERHEGLAATSTNAS